jgi:hypothetical protein
MTKNSMKVTSNNPLLETKKAKCLKITPVPKLISGNDEKSHESAYKSHQCPESILGNDEKQQECMSANPNTTKKVPLNYPQCEN